MPRDSVTSASIPISAASCGAWSRSALVRQPNDRLIGLMPNQQVDGAHTLAPRAGFRPQATWPRSSVVASELMIKNNDNERDYNIPFVRVGCALSSVGKNVDESREMMYKLELSADTKRVDS